MNIHIGILASNKGDISVFYVGKNPEELEKKRAVIAEKNKDGDRLYRISNPFLTPLASAPTASENHEDEIKARKAREDALKKAKAAAK